MLKDTFIDFDSVIPHVNVLHRVTAEFSQFITIYHHVIIHHVITLCNYVALCVKTLSIILVE